MKVLVIGLENEIVNSLEDYVKSQDKLYFEFEVFCSIENALVALDENKFSVIISDYQIGDEDGLSFLKKVRETSEIPFIFFAELPDNEGIKKALNLGVDKFIEKNIDKKECLEGLTEIIIKEGKSWEKEKEKRKSEKHFREIFNNIVRNVTERREAEKALQDSKSKIKKIHQLAAELATCEKREEVYEEALATAKNILKLDVCAFVENSNEKYNIIEVLPEEPRAHHLVEEIKNESSFLDQIIGDQEIRLIEDLLEMEHVDLEDELEYTSCLFLPVDDFGILVGLSRKKNHFVKSDLEYIELLVDHISESLKRIKIREREEFFHSLLRHDVANKIRVTDGFVDLLQETELDTTQEEYANNARISIKDAMRIIEKVRTFKELRKIDKREIKLTKVLKRSIDALRPLASEKDIEIKLEDISDEYVKAGNLLEEVISNIIENSIRHSEGTVVKITQEIENDVIVRIEDDGIGITDDEKKKIFRRGYKKGEGAGSGLGLYLVKRILENYDGYIQVRDSSFGGVRFDIRLKKT